jgi:hypothetical protein
MNTLVVYESMWGNTRAVAEAVAERLGDDVTLVDVNDAPERLPADVDLLVVGGPTHAFSMSRANTRRDAAAKGATEARVERGIREWLGEVEATAPVDVATFDTRVGGSMRHLPGSASKAAARQVRRHHLGRLVGEESFYVEDSDGPLADGELDRAFAWADSLVHTEGAHT